jgi:methionyl-tRNA formyltransferase
MRLSLIGQAAFGKAVLEALLKGGQDTVIGVLCPPDKAGAPVDAMKEAAIAAGVPCHQFKRLRSAEAIARFKSLDADLCVMAFVTDIVPLDILNSPRLGTIQYHPSLLPKHRGPSSINWPIIQGEKETGLTVFWPDAGLDTGPVLLQRKVAIGPDDTLGALYFDKLSPMGVEALLEAVRLVREGRAPRIPQDEAQATYEGWCTDEHARIDWSKPAQEVYNLIRGCNPRPGACTTVNGAMLRVFDSSFVVDDAGRAGSTAAPPGCIVTVSPAGFEVAGNGGRITLKRVQPEGARKMAAADYAASYGLKAGSMLGT